MKGEFHGKIVLSQSSTLSLMTWPNVPEPNPTEESNHYFPSSDLFKGPVQGFFVNKEY